MNRSALAAWLALPLLAAGLAAGLVRLRPWQALAAPQDSARTATAQDPSLGPGLLPVDAFHPERRPRADGSLAALPKPAYGGRVAVHIEAMPKHLCATLDNQAVTRRILYEVHETLLLRDWETTQWKPDLAVSWQVEDRLVPKPGASVPPAEHLIGTILDAGDDWLVEPKPGSSPSEPARVRKEDTQEIERESVMTFRLRDGVRWHDGHPFGARDVAFSWELYKNPLLDCGEKRQRFVKIEKVEVPDDLTVRFTLGRQYFHALETIGDMCILPRHLYDLSSPDNEDGNRTRAARPGWKPSDEEQARYVHENPRNRAWVGLGPYRIVSMTSDSLEAVRFDGYFDPENAGYFDAIRWRALAADAAFQATINGELDFFAAMTADDYFGAATQASSFTERFYKGYFYTPAYWFVGWNLLRPQLADVRVRRALAMSFDFEQFRRTFYKGLAVQVTGPFSVYSPAYDRELKPLPYDPQGAKALLDQAGWKDSDGDGVRDKDGVPLRIEVLARPNEKTATAFGAKLQEDLSRAGIQLTLATLEGAALDERKLARDFDAIALGWSPPLETDPGQVWHSRGGRREERSSNFIGFQDGQADALIERGQRELDPEKRAATWRELHRRIYELQPYLFAYNPPRKFAMNKRIRGFQSVPLTPNYVVRRWYYPEGTPGTRPTLAASATPAGATRAPEHKAGGDK